MLGGLGLFAFQESNVQRNRPGKVAAYPKPKVSQKKYQTKIRRKNAVLMVVIVDVQSHFFKF
jgi:hypothetical protein